VFLSCASQDAQAAQRICEALRAVGLEVWFDRNDLRSGDAWDQKIRREIRDCALFIPVISANTVARHQGHFRLEWDLADQRSHTMTRNRPFILSVCVDSTPETTGDTPESFSQIQWTRLPGGKPTSAFLVHIGRLLSTDAPVEVQDSHRATDGPARSGVSTTAPGASPRSGVSTTAQVGPARSDAPATGSGRYRRMALLVAAALVVLATVAYFAATG
jgi:TIR domain